MSTEAVSMAEEIVPYLGLPGSSSVTTDILNSR
jgi:hypothetical protein